MLVGFLSTATRDCILGRFELHNYAGETLRESIVDISRHPISFFQNRSLPALLGKFLELNCQHRLMSEGLRQFVFFRAVRRPVAMTNPDEPFHTPAHQRRTPQEFLCPSRF